MPPELGTLKGWIKSRLHAIGDDRDSSVMWFFGRRSVDAANSVPRSRFETAKPTGKNTTN